ncbi:MAG: HAD hydrolase-like protein [Pseudomonadota bacterium]
MNNKLPKAVIFDWDNTLVDTWPLIHFAINETMGKMDRELWHIDKVKTDIHKSMRESFPALFGKRWQEAGEIYKNAYRNQHLEKMEFLSGAMEVINFLYQKKILLFVISNKMGNTLRIEAENLKVSDKFFAIIGAGDAKFDKPHQAPVDLALQGSNLDPKKDLIWFVGDTITDIECAINSNCQPILYGKGANVPQDLIAKEMVKKEKPMLCFDNHQEILEKLKSLN